MTKIVDLLPNGDVQRVLGKTVRHFATAQSRIRQSGLVVTDADLLARVNQPGDTTEIRYIDPLAGESVASTDDLTQHIVAGKLTGGAARVMRLTRNASWEGARLTKMVTGNDPETEIRTRLAEWLALDEQKQILSTVNGVLAHARTVSGEKAKMVGGSATAAFDGAMLADACQKKGELKESLSILVIHSAVHNQLVKANMVVNVPASEQNVAFQTYQGKRLFVTDALPNAAGVYVSLLAAPGIILHASGAPEGGEIAVVSSETAGNGAGGEQLIHRRVAMQSMFGYSYKGAATDTNAKLATAANYDRVVDDKQIPLVFIESLVS